jgi:hypothetical protein
MRFDLWGRTGEVAASHLVEDLTGWRLNARVPVVIEGAAPA